MVGERRFELPVRPPHLLGGVARVAPYSSRRLPAASPFSAAWQKSLLIRRDATLLAPTCSGPELNQYWNESTKKWSGRGDLNSRPLGPETCKRENVTH
jgi:hypothetical protein